MGQEDASREGRIPSPDADTVGSMTDVSPGPQRVLAIGLDAAEPTLLRSMMTAGELPHLSALRDRGSWTALENVRSFRSESVWTAFVTGRPSQDHDYWTNVGFDPDTYGVCDVGASGLAPFWSDHRTGPTIVFDVPHTTLHADDDSLMGTAWGAHSPLYPRAGRPHGLLDEIDQRFGPHPAWGADEVSCWFDEDYLVRLRDALVEGPARRGEIVRWLWARQPEWRLTVTAFSESHSIGHHGWHGIDPTNPAAAAATAALAGDAVHRVYRAIDAEVGRLTAAAPDGTAVVVFSLHGMQTNTNDVPSTVLLPELLLRLTTGERRLVGRDDRRWTERPVTQPRFSWGQELALRQRGSLLERVAAGALDRMPPRLARAALELRSRVAGSAPPRDRFVDPEPPGEPAIPVADHRRPIDWQPPVQYQDRWPQMWAFALPTFSDAHVRLNVAGRESNGTIPPERYEQALDDLERQLRRCTDPRTGRPAVADTERVRDDDPLGSGGPPADLVVYWVPGLEAIDHPEAGRIGPVPMLRTGEHSSNGFCVVADGQVGAHQQEQAVRPASVVTDTILDLLGAVPAATPPR